jgi:hypothetical protein
VNFFDASGLESEVNGVVFDDEGQVVNEVGVESNPLLDPVDIFALGFVVKFAPRLAAEELFGKAGVLNSNRYLRVGFGRRGGQRVFRVAGSLVKRIKRSGKIDLFDCGDL